MVDTHETIADIITEMRIFKCRNLETGELESCKAIANYLADRLEDAEYHNDFSNFCDIIDSALAAPPRNCDTYNDRVEMYGVFKDWCNTRGHTMEPKLANDAFEWLLAPAAEKEGGAK